MHTDFNMLQTCDAKTLEPKRLLTYAQIDPQLLADALGLSSLNSQGGPTDGGQMHPPNVPLTDSSLFRPSSDRPLDQSATGAHSLEEDRRNRERMASLS